MSWFQTLLPIVTLIAGGLLQYLSQWGADARQRRADREAHSRELQERRENFELDHLMRLAEALSRVSRVTGKVIRRNYTTAKETGSYIPQEVPADINEGIEDSDQEVLTLVMLVLETNLRDTVATAHQRMKDLRSMKASLEQAEAAMSHAVDAMGDAQMGISDRLRQIYLGRV